VTRQRTKIGNHHQVMAGFGAGMSHQCFPKFWESKG
jgi:hypothetical protein